MFPYLCPLFLFFLLLFLVLLLKRLKREQGSEPDRHLPLYNISRS
jgi:hypothetical protein